MTKTQAINFFGSAAKLARALGLTRGAVTHWTENLPPYRQFQIHHASGGALAVDAEHLPPLVRHTPTTPAEAEAA